MEPKTPLIDPKLMMTMTSFFKNPDGSDDDVFEVVMYALSCIMLNDLTVKAIALDATEVRGIPPEALTLVKAYDDGLIRNEFWASNFVPIKSQLTLDNVKSETLLQYQRAYDAMKGEDPAQDLRLLKQMRAIMLSRFDVLTTIAFYYKGIQFANEFDFKFRESVQLLPEMDALLKENGLGE